LKREKKKTEILRRATQGIEREREKMQQQKKEKRQKLKF
jgi:hypothetical protein